MSDESGPETEQPQGESPPPGAVERIKQERDEAKARLKEAEPALRQAHLIDQLHAHFKAQEQYAGRDLYELAKQASSQPQVRDAEDPASAATEWINSMTALFQNQTAAPAPPPMAGPNPAASGVAVDEGPYKVGSKEYKDYFTKHGIEATNEAIARGQFYFSDANVAAQETAGI